MRRRPALLAALVLPLALAAACSDDGSPVVAGEDPATTAGPSVGSTATTGAPALTSVSLELRGDAEVPGPGSSGTATADLTYDGDQLCIRGATSDVGPLTAGHVHAGAAGEPGDVVVDFELTTDGDGAFEACEVVGAEGGVVVEDPTNYYVNLHTEEFPDGAVRAQLG